MTQDATVQLVMAKLICGSVGICRVIPVPAVMHILPVDLLIQ